MLKEICCEIGNVSFPCKEKKIFVSAATLKDMPLGTFGIRSSEELNLVELFFFARELAR